jgi:hypothetical protein
MTSGLERSAIGIQLDAVEQMVARDVAQGREIGALRAALTAIATAVGLTPPADVETLKKAVAELAARAAAPAAPAAGPAPGVVDDRPILDLDRIAREWLEEHPYETDEENDAAYDYFGSFSRSLVLAPSVDQVLAHLASNLLRDQGMTTLVDAGGQPNIARARAIISALRNDAILHRQAVGADRENATLRRQIEEARSEIAALKTKKGRKR